MPQPADVIFVFGSGAVEFVPARAAELFFGHFSKIIFVTGNSNGPSPASEKSEAQVFTEYLIRLGVPNQAIIKEEQATNTGENVLFGVRRLLEEGIEPRCLLLVGKPPHMRRCRATFAKHFPAIKTIPCPARGTLEDYARMTKTNSSLRLAQEIERLERYAQRGYIEEQIIPAEVKRASASILERYAAD